MDYKSILAVIGAAISYLFGGWTIGLQTLLVFVVIDYLTGVAVAAKDGRLSSYIGMKGIGRKVIIFMFVSMGHMADLNLSDGQVHLFRDGVTTFFLVNEGISITENAGRLGVPIPPTIQRAIELLKKTDSNKKEESKNG